MKNDMTNWTPTENQLKALKHAQEQRYDYSVTALCQAIGIARQSYYGWFETPEFSEWWINALERHFGQRLGKWYQGLEQIGTGASDGKASAYKILLERFDKAYLPKTKQQVQHSGGVGVEVDLEHKTKEELERFAHATELDVDKRHRERGATKEPGEAAVGTGGD